MTLTPARAGRAGLVGLPGARPPKEKARGLGSHRRLGGALPPLAGLSPPSVPWVRVTWRHCLPSSLLPWASPVARVAQAQRTRRPAPTRGSACHSDPAPLGPDDGDGGDGDRQALMASALCPTLCRAHPRDPSTLLRCLRRKVRPTWAGPRDLGPGPPALQPSGPHCPVPGRGGPQDSGPRRAAGAAGQGCCAAPCACVVGSDAKVASSGRAGKAGDCAFDL